MAMIIVFSRHFCPKRDCVPTMIGDQVLMLARASLGPVHVLDSLLDIC